ncbi:uncharacterized protein LOC128234594 [Mya arenaria]|uniref:uncharacterized protein LOC128234594 n=1 Tax=Mya arenaria TaxID=6604 RepID=UPI0022E81469|nr:uncharacterized protein LOC128234594 [Mya arenaria]
MPSQAESRRSLFNVKLASWFVRLSAIFCMVASGITMAITDVEAVAIISFVVGCAALTQPLLASCCYNRNPESCTPWKLTTGKIILYIWLFFTNCVLVTFIGYGIFYLYVFAIPYAEYFFTTWIGILLLFVFLISIVLTAVNIYTFCVLHKNGCCFMKSLNRDILNVDPEATPVAIIMPTQTVTFGRKPELDAATSCNVYLEPPPPYQEQCPPYLENKT